MRHTLFVTLLAAAATLLAACGGSSAPAAGGNSGGGQSLAPPPGGLGSRACAVPGANWQQVAPESVQLDSGKLADALLWANVHTGLSTAVYRHGCLAGQSELDLLTSLLPLDGWSMTKSLTGMLVARAATLGLLDLDAPIGKLFPEADAAHARLSLRQLMNETSGMSVNYARELDPLMPSRPADALSLPFVYTPGTTWQYAQSVVDLTLAAVGRAAGMDVQAFAQRELFDPIGIQSGSYLWLRDPSGNTQGWAHMMLRNGDWARLAHLMLWGGNWNGRQLIAPDLMRQLLARSADNPAYGLLFWLNGGSFWRTPAIEGPDNGQGPVLPSGPPDLFAYIGLGEQRIYVIPSRDLVIVRLGENGSINLDTRDSLFSSRAGQVDWEILRRVMLAVQDVPYTDPGPFESAGLVLPPLDDGIFAQALQLDQVLAGAGVGPGAPKDCTVLGC